MRRLFPNRVRFGVAISADVRADKRLFAGVELWLEAKPFEADKLFALLGRLTGAEPKP